ncbi:MAG: DUF1501 domain-containing protein, partial [Opitutales bacterium]
MSPLTRREVLRRCSLGFGGVALSGLLATPAYGAATTAARPGKAKNVIFCYMSGGVSHVDSFDPKPALTRLHGKPMPVPVQRTVFNNNGNIMGSPWEAKARGKSGIEMTDLFPNIAALADELTVVRSMTSKVSEHAQGNYFFHTGFPFMGHPSAGAWMTYGLGSENQNLPGFVVLQSGGAVVPHGGVGLFSNGYLPGQHQASIIKADAAAALDNIRPAQADAAQRRRLAFIGEVDRAFAEAAREPQVEAAIRNYETA